MSASSSGLSNSFGRKRESQADQADEAASTGESVEDSQEPVVVWEAANQMEAQIVAGRLETEGIPAMIRGEAASTVFGLSTGNLAAAEVLVPAPLAQRATEILATDVDWDELADSEASGEEFDEASEEGP